MQTSEFKIPAFFACLGLWGLAPGPVSYVCKETLCLLSTRGMLLVLTVKLWVLKPTAVTSAPKRKADMVSLMVNIRRLVVSPFSFLNASGLTVLVKSIVACF